MGYTGFRPYGIREYPTKKPGKELEDNNEIWAATYRDRDQKNMLENYHNSKTVYRKHYLENTMPWHYEKDYNKKTSTINAHGSNAKNSSYGFDKEGNRLPPGEFRDASEGDIPHLDGTKLLNTGTEHWRSIYQDINDAAKNRDPKGMSRTMTSGLGGNGTGGKKGYEGDAGHPDGNPSGKDDLEALLKRSQSLGKNASKTSTGFGRNSLGKNGLHRSNARTGTTQYKFHYGERIGHTPFDLLNKDGVKQPLRDNPLKFGTNQMWTEIPGYQGFKPAEVPFSIVREKIEARKSINKGIMKDNIGDNYHTGMPGYSGHKPKYGKTTGVLRENCFSYK